MKNLTKLFSPGRIGSLEIRNRIVMCPMGTNFAAPDGSCTDKLINYHVARAKGGVGLDIVEITAVSTQQKALPFGTGIWDDKQIPGWRQLVNAVHPYGAKIFIEICHVGRQTYSSIVGGEGKLVAPSPIPCPVCKDMPRELTTAEVEPIVEDFGEAARRAREAGFDGVEIHGTHGYLIAGFMSAYQNRRTDKYGGSLENRLRFPLEIIRRVRRKVGRDYPVIMRIAGYEPDQGGRSLEETKVIAPILVAAGLDGLDVTVGTYGSIEFVVSPPSFRPGFNVVSAEAIKRTVSVPVIAVGRINDPLIAEQILEEGRADFIGMGRAFICDPEWPNKAAGGESEDIRRCMGCTQGCEHPDGIFGPRIYMSCVINPEVGKEKEMALVPAAKPRKVLIAGGGPGGLEAARVAALRGHQVTLCEKTHHLGGQYAISALAPNKQELATAIGWFANQAEKAGVKIEMGKAVTPALVNQLKPDVVIVATGAVPLIPDIPGAKKPKVVTAHDVLAGKVMVGNKVVMMGGGLVGCETADYLLEQGKEVTIVEMLADIGLDAGFISGKVLLERLVKYGVKKITSATVAEILDDGVVYTKEGKKESIRGVDNIVLAMGAKPVNELADQLKGKVDEVHVIGDAKEARKAFDAVAEGAEIARKI